MPSTLLVANGYASNSADNTIWRAMGTAVSNAFANAGWVQANDAGQVDWTTVVANGTANSTLTRAYEIWRMNDALQNTTPCFVKLEWRTIFASNNPGFVVTFGGGSDGQGNLTGAISANTPLRMGTAVSTTVTTAAFRGDSNNITILLNANNALNWPVYLNVERTKDSNGNDTANGFIINMGGGSPAASTIFYSQFYWHPNIGPGPAESDVGVFLQTVAWGGSGNVTHLYPVYPNRGIFLNPFMNCMYAHIGQVSVNSPFTVTFYGQPHTYVSFPNMAAYSNRSGQTAGLFNFAIRWE